MVYGLYCSLQTHPVALLGRAGQRGQGTVHALGPSILISQINITVTLG